MATNQKFLRKSEIFRIFCLGEVILHFITTNKFHFKGRHSVFFFWSGSRGQWFQLGNQDHPLPREAGRTPRLYRAGSCFCFKLKYGRFVLISWLEKKKKNQQMLNTQIQCRIHVTFLPLTFLN